MKIMIVNPKTKQKPKTTLGRIRNLVLDFILYFVTPIHVTCAQGKHLIHYASLEELSKKKKYDKQFTTVTTHKNVQNYYNEKCAKYLMFDLKKIQRSYLS